MPMIFQTLMINKKGYSQVLYTLCLGLILQDMDESYETARDLVI